MQTLQYHIVDADSLSWIIKRYDRLGWQTTQIIVI